MNFSIIKLISVLLEKQFKQILSRFFPCIMRVPLATAADQGDIAILRSLNLLSDDGPVPDDIIVPSLFLFGVEPKTARKKAYFQLSSKINLLNDGNTLAAAGEKTV